MRRFLKKLSRKTNKPFKDIPLDRPATYKQRWAVAGKFARECADEYPNKTENRLAAVFNAVILNYHSDPNNSEFTHGDVQSYLDGEKTCPDYYKKLIDSKAKRNSKNMNNNQVFDLSDEKKVKQFIKLYKQKRTLDQIGNVFGMSRGSVINYVKKLRDQGVDIDLRGQGAQTGKQSLDLSDKTKVQQFINLYKEGKTLQEIGDAFGMSVGSARNYVKKLKDQGADIKLRGQGGAAFDINDNRKVRRFIKFYNEGYTLKDIGDAFGMSHGSVINYVKKLKDRGVDIDLRGQGNRTDTNSSFRRKNISTSIKKNKSSNQALLDLMNTQKRK